MEVEPPCFLVIGGDQMIYCLGRIAWYIVVGGNLYWVTNPGVWLKLPPPETLEQIRLADRERLQAWLRAYQPAPIQSLAPPPLRPRPPRPPGTDYQELAEEIDFRAEELDAEERRGRIWAKERTKEHQAELAALINRIEQRMIVIRYGNRFFANCAHGFIDDHDYIEAMFAHYSRGRSRLL